MRKPKLSLRITALGLIAALAVIDQLVKVWAQQNLQGAGRVVAIPGVLGFRYAENSGISFGLFGQNPGVMMGITIFTGVVMLLGIVWFMLGKLDRLGMFSAALIIGGGIGNFIDRLIAGYVVDYIEFLFMNFAIFNLADVFITVGVFGLIAATILTERRKMSAEVVNHAL